MFSKKKVAPPALPAVEPDADDIARPKPKPAARAAIAAKLKKKPGTAPTSEFLSVRDKLLAARTKPPVPATNSYAGDY